jgi:hypothetical protein
MKIRSITLFANPGSTINDDFLGLAARFCETVGEISRDLDLEIQTIRLATPPFPQFLSGLNEEQMIDYAVRLEETLAHHGFAYISLGPALPDYPASYALIPDLIQATQNTFFSSLMTQTGKGVSLQAVKASGEIIHRLAPQDPNGFANLYFAALGNVQAGGPFFPAAYHNDHGPAFAIAVEGADLALKAFQEGKDFTEARSNLITVLEENDAKLVKIAAGLEGATKTSFSGIDYSLAPYPDQSSSIGSALESLGVERIGQQGSLAAAAFLADTIDRASIHRTGFSGLMLPVLEDSTLAQRAADGSLGIKDLLLFSAVCGTGLDTIPLPGDSSAEQISAVLMDLAVLSLRLNKPLTARLMPIPGKKAGEETHFDFPFFANSRVMELNAEGLSRAFSADGYLDIKPRQKGIHDQVPRE